MSGLLLGIISGSIVTLASFAGSIAVLFKTKWSDNSRVRLDFFIGLIFIIAVATQFKASLILSFLLGTFFIIFARQFIDFFIMPLASVTHIEYRAVVILLMLLCKNFADGLAAGAVINIEHSGIRHSLLSAIVLQDLFDGLIFAVQLIVLEVSPFVAVIGALGSGVIEFFSALFGSYFSKEFSGALPLIMSFSAGVLMGPVIEESATLAIRETKHILRPRLVNGFVVMLILIFGKELL